jgi:hypothetical protein
MVDIANNPAQFEDADEDVINNNKTSSKQVKLSIINNNESELPNQEDLNDYSDDDFDDEDDDYYSDMDDCGKGQTKGPNSQVLFFNLIELRRLNV